MRARGLAEIGATGEVDRAGWTGWMDRLVKRLGWLLRAAGLPTVSRRRPRLRVLEQVALGNRRQLFLVACAGERYLVGAGSDTVGSIVRVERLARRDRMERTSQAGDERAARAFPVERTRGLRPGARA